MRFLREESDPQGGYILVSAGSRKAGMGILAVLFLSFLFLFVDRAAVSWIKDVGQARSSLFFLFENVNPVIAFLGHGATLITGSLIVYVGGKFISERTHALGRTLVMSLLSAGVVVQIMKHLAGRARPSVGDTVVFIGPSFRSGYDSFPSGHATAVFAFAYVLSHYLPTYRYLFYSFAVVVGFERIGDLAHFPSDVFSGAVVGIIVAKLLVTKTLRYEKA